MRRILADLYVGPAAHAEDVPRLRRAGITAILSLQEPGRDLPPAAIERVRAACGEVTAYRNVAVRDYDPHDLARRLPEVLAALGELRREGRVVYLHCCEGVNRSPSVALACLVRLEAMDIDDALAHLRRVDPVGRPYAEFIAFLRA